MKTFVLALKYNGRYLLLIAVFFIVCWHTLSVHQKINQVALRTTTVIEQNTNLLKNALMTGDARELQKILWSTKLSTMPFVRIEPALSRDLWFEPIAVGDPLVQGPRYVFRQLSASEHGLVLGTVSYALDLLLIHLNTISDNLVLYILFVFLLTLGLGLASFGTVRAMVRLEQQLAGIEQNQTRPELWANTIVEPKKVTGYERRFHLFIQNIMTALKKVALLEIENTSHRKMINVASQLAHDIRSPLAALNVATSDLKEVPEEKRLLIRSAVQRIEDIANDLASRKEGARDQGPGVRGQTERDTEEKRSTHHLTSIIQAIISEKRTEHQQRANVKIELQCEECAYNYFAKIQPSEFKRILSNIINNSYEAIIGQSNDNVFCHREEPERRRGDPEHNENTGLPRERCSLAMTECVLINNSATKLGKIDVNVFEKETMVSVSVHDNGCGIPAEKLPQLMQRGASFGKEGGHGLGLFHAKETIESWGGAITIESQEGLGATVTLSLPKQPVPGWFVSEIHITKDQHVVILDDDESIHLVWKGRLREHGIDKDHVHHFTKPDQLIEWHRKSYTTPIRPNGHLPPSMGKERLFLCDYELLGSLKTGLDVIKELGIASQSILVTSHYEEKEIRDECKRLGIKLLPKSLAGFVPVSIVPTCRCADVPKLENVDCILIDDEELIHTTWAIVAKMKQKKIAHFNRPNEFLKVIDQYSPQTAIYIDSDLGNGVKGEIAAQEIFNKGFKEIYLCTGSEPKEYPEMGWIKAIVGKGVPFG